MEIKEIVQRLEPWAEMQKSLHVQLEAFCDLTGATYDRDLLRPVISLWIAYTAMVSESVGDKSEWLQWYEFECRMGKTPMEATVRGVTIKVETLEQLARVII